MLTVTWIVQKLKEDKTKRKNADNFDSFFNALYISTSNMNKLLEIVLCSFLFHSIFERARGEHLWHRAVMCVCVCVTVYVSVYVCVCPFLCVLRVRYRMTLNNIFWCRRKITQRIFNIYNDYWMIIIIITCFFCLTTIKAGAVYLFI